VRECSKVAEAQTSVSIARRYASKMQQTQLVTNRERQGGRRWECSVTVLLAGLLIGFNFLVFVLVQRGNSDFEKGDFKMYYTAAVALRSGHAADLYSRDLHASMQRQLLPSLPLRDVKVYTHPPYELLVFLPLSFLPYKVACYCWLALTLLLAVLCGRLLSGYAAVLGLFPFLVIMLEQQDSILVLLALIGCWLALREGKHARAGFLLGLALFRFQLVIPLAILLLFWKPKLLRGLALSGTLVALLSLVMVGPAGLRSYFAYASAMAHDSATAVSQRYQIDPRTNPTLRGITYELMSRDRESVPPAAAQLLPVALGLLDLLCLAFAWKFLRTDAHPEVKFAFAVLLALLLSFHLLMHDLVLLALPFVLLRGLPARWPLAPFYLAPLLYCFYPHSQAWLALLLVSSSFMIMSPKAVSGSRIWSCWR
jgi:glycosyl transferase family 87